MVPADGQCLFNSLAYTLEGGRAGISRPSLCRVPLPTPAPSYFLPIENKKRKRAIPPTTPPAAAAGGTKAQTLRDHVAKTILADVETHNEVSKEN